MDAYQAGQATWGNSCGRKLLREFVELKEKHLQVMRHGLNIIDSTIRMHEIPIVPERIHPIHVQVRERKFKYGNKAARSWTMSSQEVKSHSQAPYLHRGQE